MRFATWPVESGEGIERLELGGLHRGTWLEVESGEGIERGAERGMQQSTHGVESGEGIERPNT